MFVNDADSNLRLSNDESEADKEVQRLDAPLLEDIGAIFGDLAGKDVDDIDDFEKLPEEPDLFNGVFSDEEAKDNDNPWLGVVVPEDVDAILENFNVSSDEDSD